MSAPLFVLVMLGGGIGACLRFIVDGLITRRVHTSFPLGTFLINTSGSFVLGLLTGLADSSVIDSDWLFVLGAGVLVFVTVGRLAPYAPLLPRWVTLGTAGLLLLVLGATYERRRQQAREAVAWVGQMN